MGRLIAALALACAGCAPRLIDPIRWTPVVEHEVADVREIIGTPPAALLAGDAAPFDGWLVTGDDWQRIKDELRSAKAWLVEAYNQDREDRDTASRVDAAKIEALRTCRESQWRSFAAGAGVGAGACGALGFGLQRVP